MIHMIMYERTNLVSNKTRWKHIIAGVAKSQDVSKPDTKRHTARICLILDWGCMGTLFQSPWKSSSRNELVLKDAQQTRD